jgi:hypothetical protein
MGTILRRAFLPTVLAIGGVAMILYGVLYHVTPVLESHETKFTIDIPAPFQSERPPPFPGGPPFGGPPSMIKKTITRTDQTTIMEREPGMTREVTVGGVELRVTGARIHDTIKVLAWIEKLAGPVRTSGEIWRTYDPKSGKGPAVCPT